MYYRHIFTSFLLLGIIGLTYLGFSNLPKSTVFKSSASQKELEPIGLRVGNISQNSAEITWLTQIESMSILFYSPSEDCLKGEINTTECPFVSENDKTTNHIIKLKGLKADSTYFYKIKTDNNIYPDNSIFSFSTFAEPASQDVSEPESDSEGITTPKSSSNMLQTDNSNGQILGNKQKIDLALQDFKYAMDLQNLSYDFNKDSKVDLMDYPLYLQFINNKED